MLEMDVILRSLLLPELKVFRSATHWAVAIYSESKENCI